MYMMVRIDPAEFKDIEDDIEFCKKFAWEQCVMVIPSNCFLAKNFFRMVVCTTVETME
jgi:tyrosine aminotransferase